MNGFEDVSDSAARLVSRHLISLVGDARRSGVPLHEITIELAAHAACAALSFWSVDDLHALIDVADEDDVTPPGSLPSVDLPSLVGSLRRTPH